MPRCYRVSYSQHRKNPGVVLEKMQMNAPEEEKLARNPWQ